MFAGKLFLTLLLMAVMLAAATEKWPDFDCVSVPDIPGPSTRSSADEALLNIEESNETWEDCSSKESETGSCAKLCWLGEYLVLGTKIEKLADQYGFQKGYYGENKTSRAEEEKVVAKIRSNLLSCSQKHSKLTKEMDGWYTRENNGGQPNELADFNFGSCEKYKPLLDCVDKALGCSRTKKL